MAEHHGMYGTPTYKSWAEMKHRCGNPKKSDYRIDPEGDYCKENCRWADWETQENNRTNNRRFLYEGEKLTIPQIARKYGISRSNLANKIYIKKMDIVEAVDYLRREC